LRIDVGVKQRRATGIAELHSAWVGGVVELDRNW
jgi:hypothetical protein